LARSAPPISRSPPARASACRRPSGRGRPHWSAGPAGAAALYCRDGAGWLGVAATIPAYRRRGVQGALMARRIADAIAGGCRDIVSETGEAVPGEPNDSYANLLRNGFSVVYSRPNYVVAG
jgi:hypothetical protein